MLTPYERAIQPSQYDTGWAKEGGADSTRTQFFWEYLKPYSNSWREKTMLDIGAGTGWLVSRALKNGAIKAVGIEPSKNNMAQGKHDHPDLELVQTTVEGYDSQHQRFDVITAVMSFPHIADLNAAFGKIRSLLKEGGEVIAIVPDYDYFKIPRHGYDIEIQPLDAESYATSVTRPSGTLADIVRKTGAYRRGAEVAGLELIEDTGMKPTEHQIANAPKYAAVKDMALTRLLRFRVRKDLDKM